jgi:NADH-quinone oxidoreductase subunit M
MADFGLREMTVMILMMIGLLVLGIYPQPMLDLAAPTLNNLPAVAP